MPRRTRIRRKIIAILNKLKLEINAALADPTFKARLVDLGGIIRLQASPTDFGKFIVEYTEKWGKVIRAAGIKAE